MDTQTQDAFVALDHELTGKSIRDCQHTARGQLQQDIYELQSNLYYLSDSGYSRLRIGEDFTVHLAMGARAEVQLNWEYADRAINALNRALRTEELGITERDIAETRNPSYYPENR